MEQERRKYDDLLARVVANVAVKLANDRPFGAYVSEVNNADNLISALRNAGILVEFSQGGLDTAKKQQRVQA